MADQVELVDIEPEDLILRLQSGKVYRPGQARRALDHFFTKENLEALREIALRRTACLLYTSSGGMQTQGHEALDVLHGLVYAPVALAIQAQVNDTCVRRLVSGEIPEVKDAFLANAQSKVLLVEFREPIAEAVLREAEKLGAAPNPVGAESKYEMVPRCV